MLFIFRLEDRGHAIVNGSHELVRFCRDDSEAFDFAAVWLAPNVPQSRKAERYVCLHLKLQRFGLRSVFIADSKTSLRPPRPAPPCTKGKNGKTPVFG